MQSEKTKFQNFLKEQGFHISPVLSTFDLVPHYYIDKNKNHNLINNISCCVFEAKTKTGSIGHCITFYYSGTQRKYRQKYINIIAEIFKKVIVCNTAKQAIKEYTLWKKEATLELQTMKMIL
jgi:hypothetical protein